MDRNENGEQPQPGPSGITTNIGNSSNDTEHAEDSSSNQDNHEPQYRRFTSFGTQIRMLTEDGSGYYWKMEDSSEDDSDDEPTIIPMPSPPQRRSTARKARRPRIIHLRPARANTDLDLYEDNPASLFDYPNRSDNNNTSTFPNLNVNHFIENNQRENDINEEPQNEESDDDMDYPYYSDHSDEEMRDITEIECRLCNRVYSSGILFVRTICEHLICVPCTWEYATNFGRDTCPICQENIDYTESVHIDDIHDGNLRFRKNNN